MIGRVIVVSAVLSASVIGWSLFAPQSFSNAAVSVAERLDLRARLCPALDGPLCLKLADRLTEQRQRTLVWQIATMRVDLLEAEQRRDAADRIVAVTGERLEKGREELQHEATWPREFAGRRFATADDLKAQLAVWWRERDQNSAHREMLTGTIDKLNGDLRRFQQIKADLDLLRERLPVMAMRQRLAETVGAAQGVSDLLNGLESQAAAEQSANAFKTAAQELSEETALSFRQGKAFDQFLKTK